MDPHYFIKYRLNSNVLILKSNFHIKQIKVYKQTEAKDKQIDEKRRYNGSHHINKAKTTARGVRSSMNSLIDYM